MKYEYDAILHETDTGGAYVAFPWDLRKEFGRGRMKVCAEFDGMPYDGSIVNMGVKNPDGSVCYVIGVLKAIRAALNKANGDTVHVVITERKQTTEDKTVMEHRIVKKAQFTVVGVKRRFDSDTSRTEIPKFWDELMAKGEDRPIMGTFGLCLDMEGKEFDYWIADLYFPWEEIPEGCETRVVPAGLWAEFPCTLETLQATNTKIRSEWLPALSGYSVAGEYDVEVYLPPEDGSEEMRVGIWVPLKQD